MQTQPAEPIVCMVSIGVKANKWPTNERLVFRSQWLLLFLLKSLIGRTKVSSSISTLYLSLFSHFIDFNFMGQVQQPDDSEMEVDYCLVSFGQLYIHLVAFT